MSWIEEARRQPSDDLVRLIIKAKGLGHASPARVERMRRSFVATFEAYMDRETDRLLDAARDQQREDPRPASDEPGTASKKKEEPAVVDLGDGGAPIGPNSHERAWRVKGGPWQRESNGRNLMPSVIRHLASIDVRGRQRFYGEAVDRWGSPCFRRPRGGTGGGSNPSSIRR